MTRSTCGTAPSIFWALLLSLLFVNYCEATSQKQRCHTSCGSLRKIAEPFRLKQDPASCGRPEPDFEITCLKNQALLYLNSRKYYVMSISYWSGTIVIIDSTLQSRNFSSLPPPTAYMDYYHSNYFPPSPLSVNTIVFLNCSVPIEDNPYYIPTAPCMGHNSSSYPTGSNLYAIVGYAPLLYVDNSCMIMNKVNGMVSYPFPPDPTTCSEIHNIMMRGFKLRWYQKKGPLIIVMQWIIGKEAMQWIIGCGLLIAQFSPLYFAARTSIGLLCFSIFLVYKLRRKKIWMDSTVEEFLSKFGYQIPRRYSYSDIKNITRNFKERLGQGGYGSVFKGRLSTGRQVAVKLLNKSKCNGQEYINEVATIGRIHHVNVIRLIGFCSDGSKRALIYDFMPNGSLEKYIFGEQRENQLCWDKMYQIALGIAHGIQYLHEGCNMRILHFDIKPHNILLDENFTPKVSDFGLAKLCPTDDSIVSMTAARGTLGYIAPELLYKNIGDVSHKSDVYSFGMLLLEMAGKRQNIDAFAENSSQVYFPLWIYDQLHRREETAMEDVADTDKEIAKKLIMVALWCIQVKPINRPSISKVVEMLEGNLKDLQLAPKPLLSVPPQVLHEAQAINIEVAESSSSSLLKSITKNIQDSEIIQVIED